MQRILVVDDERPVLDAATRALQRRGYDVCSTERPEEALDLLRGGGFDLLLTDVRMPGVDGLDLMRLAREDDPHLPVVLFTGYGTIELALRAIENGVTGFLVKPFTLEELSGAVQEALRKAHLARENARFRELLPLVELGRTLASEHDLPALAARVVDAAQQGVEAGQVWLYVADGTRLLVARGLQPLDEAPAVELSWWRAWIQAVASSREAQPPGAPGAPPTLPEGLTFPLVASGQAVGCLAAVPARAGSESVKAFADSEREWLAHLAGQAAVAVLNTSLVCQLERANADLAATNRRIAEREQRYRSLFEHNPEAVLALHVDGHVLHVNAACERLLGTPAEALEGTDLATLLADEPERIAAAVRAAGAGVSTTSDLVLGSPGQQTKVRLTLLPTVVGGDVVGAYGVLLDRSAEQRLLQSEKLRALGQLAGGVAHDLNQSLTLIAGHAELVSRRLADGSLPRHEELLQAAETIGRAARAGGRTASRLLAFSRGGTGEPRKPIMLADLLAEVADLSAPRWRDEAQAEGRPIHLTVECAHEVAVAGWADPLRDALLNLVFNAIDALPHGGCIRLAARRHGNRVHLSVVDTGIGIPATRQARLFEPFYTTKGERGTGLGLAQVYGAVSAMDGDITVHATPGGGTTFLLDLPGVHGADADGESAATPPPAGRPLRVLAVDDEPALAHLVKLLLETRGHSVDTVTSAEDALERLEGEPFDVVVSDFGLGNGMNGRALAREVAARWPGIRFVLATGWAATVDEEEARADGISLVLPKPYTGESLARALCR